MFFAAVIILLLGLIFINPGLFVSSSYNAISTFALKVLPVCFPFFFLTKILSGHEALAGFRKKHPGIYVFFLSVLCGYPIGAKLISELYESGETTRRKAMKMMSFCSSASPVFVLGTIGVGFIFNLKMAWIILIANIFGNIAAGILFNIKKCDNKDNFKKETILINQKSAPKGYSRMIGDAVYDSVKSILIMGGYIVIFNVLIDLTHLNTLFPGYIGLLEAARGCYQISQMFTVNKLFQGIFITGLISFGGICVHLQSVHFLFKAKISYYKFLIQKVCHSLFSMIIFYGLFLIFF